MKFASFVDQRTERKGTADTEGDGKDGQFCIVLPEQDAVIAITANTRDMQAELNIVWDKLLPAFGDKPQEENPDEQAKLNAVIAKLKASR